MDDSQTTTFRMGALDHVHVFVPDREAAAEWYVSVLGFEVVHPEWAEDPGGPLTVSADGVDPLVIFLVN